MHYPTKPTVILFAVFCLFAAFAGSARSQDTVPVPAVKAWAPLVGHWVNEEQQRNSPDESWQKVSSEWDIRMMRGGFFVETPGKMTFPDGSVSSWIQVWGYDPGKKATFGYWFNTEGNQGKSTFEWSGSTMRLEGIDLLADGTEVKVRCTWENANNYTSSEGMCERLEDGEWWIFRTVKGKKVD